MLVRKNGKGGESDIQDQKIGYGNGADKKKMKYSTKAAQFGQRDTSTQEKVLTKFTGKSLSRGGKN